MLNILNVAQSGLKISQTQVENVMNNLANENTPGYKKRVVNISELDYADSRLTGRGVQIEDVSRVTNVYLYQNLIREESKLSSINELSSMLSNIESIFKETDTSGMSADINRYFKSIENLRTSPQNEVYKSDLANNAKVIVANLKTMYSDIEKEKESTLLGIKENVEKVNSILHEIGNISQKIVENTSSSSNDLLDKRDMLEKELAQYIDVEISRDDHYQLKIAGITAVRFDTNVEEIKLVENYTPQSDVYAKVDRDGKTIVPYEDSLIPDTWVTAPVSEEQVITLSGLVDDKSGDAPGTAKTIKFLGTTVPTTMNADATTLAQDIANDAVRGDVPETGIIAKWNKEHPEQEIETITNNGNKIEIKYKDIEGDVPAIDNSSDNGINFTGSIETTKGKVDSLTFVYNNEVSLTVTKGEIIVDNQGNQVDLDGDGILGGDDIVTKDNVLKAMMYKINQSKDIGGNIKVYNGAYEPAEDGTKILTNDSRHPKFDKNDPNKDRYLVIESSILGEEGSFVGEFLVNDSQVPNINGDLVTAKHHSQKNESLSKQGIDDIHLEIFEKEIEIKSGTLKPMIDNVKTDSGNNVFNQYQEKLDQFAKTLSNLTDAYIENEDKSYVYGTDAIELHSDEDKKINLNLFSGANVKSLKFNGGSLNNLTQNNLDYLATIQWKEDINFDEKELNHQSFSQFYQTLRVDVADNKENVAFKQGAQSAVKESMENAYNKITKVDKDAEMIELIKFQSAYSANAKMVTVVDEMLQTLLGMKR